MARRPRIDLPGFHHIINRGVARGNVFKKSQDKDKFLEILCKSCKNYKVNIHAYCLMDNHYHLLVETTSNNLSLFMRQINSNYAIYFNKKYKRSGHLWQGRYKSYYIIEDNYLYSLFKYIEHNPIEAKISKSVGEYPYTLLHSIINKKAVIRCALHSRLLNEYSNLGLQEFMQKELTKQELDNLKDEQKRKIVIKEHSFKQLKTKSLDEHFIEVEANNKQERNIAILNAIEDGYTQGEVARYLNISTAMVSYIYRNY